MDQAQERLRDEPSFGQRSLAELDSDDVRHKYRHLFRNLGVKPLIARLCAELGCGPGTQRCIVERAFAHLHRFRRVRIRCAH
jgi:hypothetical protein